MVTIRVRVPAEAHPGKELEYRLLVQNPTTADAHHVRIRAPVPTNSRFLRANPKPDDPLPSKNEEQMIWALGTMKGGTSKEILLVVEPTGAGVLQCCARVQFEHGQCVQTKLTQPDLRVRLLGPTQLLLHDPAKFQIEVSNVGKREAPGVVLTHTLPDGLEFSNSNPSTKGDSNPLTWSLGSIPPGQNKRVEVDVLAKAIGTQLNKAEAKDGTGQQQQTTLKTEVVEPKLDLIVTGPHRRLLGRSALYQMTIGNPGTAPASNVEVWSILPAKIELVSASNGGRLNGSELRWKLGTLAPGAKQTLQAVLQTRESGRFDFWVNASADRLQLVKKGAKTEFEGVSNLSAEIDKHPDPLQVGKTGTYTLRLVNQGSKQANEVQAVLTLPDELKSTATPKGNALVRQEGQKIIVGPFELPANSDATVTVTAEALKPGEVRLRCEVTAKELTSGPLHFEEPATLYSDSPGARAP